MTNRYYDKQNAPTLDNMIEGTTIKVWVDGAVKPYTGRVVRTSGSGIVFLEGVRGARATVVQNIHSTALYCQRGVETCKLVACVEVG